MAALVGKYAANKFLKKHMKQYEQKKVNDGYVSISPQPYKHPSLTYRPGSILCHGRNRSTTP